MRSARSSVGLVAAVAGFALICSVYPAAADRSPAGQDDKGKQEFGNAGCATCHGPAAKGGDAPALAGMSRPYPDFVKIVREGSGEMPPHSKSDVSDDQLTVIYKWLVQLPSQGDDAPTAERRSRRSVAGVR